MANEEQREKPPIEGRSTERPNKRPNNRPNKVDADAVAEIFKKRGRCPSG